MKYQQGLKPAGNEKNSYSKVTTLRKSPGTG